MHQAIWKLTALAVVVGVGVLVVVQAQRGFNSLDQKAESSAEATDEEGDGSNADDGETAASSSNPLNHDDDESFLDDEPPVTSKVKAKPVVNRAAPAVGRGGRDPFELDDQAEPPPLKQPKQSKNVAAERKSKPGLFEEDDEDDHVELMADVDDATDEIETPKAKSVRGPAVDIADVPDEDESATSVDRGASRQPGAGRPAARNRPLLQLNVDEDEFPGERQDDAGAEPDAEEGGGLRLSGPRSDSLPRLTPVLNEEPEGDAAETDDAEFQSGRTGSEAQPESPRRLPDSVAPDNSGWLDDDEEPQAELSVPNRPAAKEPPSRPLGSGLFDDDEDEPAADTPAVESSGPPRSPGTPSRPTPMNAPDEEDSISVKPRSAPPARPIDDPADFTGRNARPSARPDAPGKAPASRPEPEDEAGFGKPPAKSPAAGPPALRPQVTIEKVAPSEAALGKPMVYHIHVRNQGEIAARSVVVEDTVPKDVTIDGSIPQAELDGRRLLWKLGTLEPGHVKKISVRVIPHSEGTLGSVATVNFANMRNSGDGAAAAPKLKFTIDAPPQAAVGTLVTFKFHVANAGTIDAHQVVLRDVLPAGLQHPDGDDLEYEIGVLAAGESRDIELPLTAAATGKVVNRVIVTAQGNLTEERHAAVEVLGPSLGVSRLGPKRLFPGKSGKYTNTISNPGSTPIEDVRVVEALPPGLEYVEASDGGEYSPGKRAVTWTVDRLAPGETRPLRVQLKSIERGAQISVVRVSDAGGTRGETAGTTHVSGVPALVIEMGELPSLIESGEEVKIPFRIINTGSDAASEVRAIVTLPPGLELVAVKAPMEYKRNNTLNKVAGRDRQFKSQQELQFEPIGRLDVRNHAQVELTLKARQTGTAKIQVEVQCDQIDEPVRHDRVTTVAAVDE